MVKEVFQSTPLTRGETSITSRAAYIAVISIHSPHTRGDDNVLHQPAVFDLFQSTPLTRGETTFSRTPDAALHFNPLPSYEGRLIHT